jgi:toxin ParE1/3/4
MAEIGWTSEAQTWLKDIHDYISGDNPSVALKLVQEIYDKTQILRQSPDIGYVYRSEKEGEIRILLYGHYRIAYLRRKENDIIDILGVFHGALDIERYIEAGP